MLQMDITDIVFRDGMFDVIYCSHVLEHIPDDRAALGELARVLAPGGWAAFAVPIGGDVTLEDPSVIDPRERERLYGQHDHVREYGLDFKDRLVDAGFSVDVYSSTSTLSADARSSFGVPSGEYLFICSSDHPQGA